MGRRKIKDIIFKIKQLPISFKIITALTLCAVIITLAFAPQINDLFNPPLPEMADDIDFTCDVNKVKQRANLADRKTGFCESEADTLRNEIINAQNTDEIYNITGTKYYVSSSTGDDNNDGLSPDAPVKTINKLLEVYLKKGDAILLKRGDTFRLGESFYITQNTFLGAYGEGSKPKIYGSPENYALSDKWEKHVGYIWKIPFEYPEACGLVINHSALVGIKKSDISTLSRNGDYYHDFTNGIFYIYCSQGNPKSVYKDIEIMPSFNLIDAVDGNCNVVIDNICLKYSSGFAIHTIGASDFTVTNCEIGFLGGKWTASSERTLRYGNAIEFWEGGKNITVKNNWFYQIFDSALTWQGKSGNVYENIEFSENLFEYNNADIEFFETDATLTDFSIKDNIMRFTSMGWGTRSEDGGIRGIEGCIRGVTGSHPTNQPVNVESVYFKNNLIDSPARQIINWSWEPEHSNVIHASGTRIYVNSDYRTLLWCLQGLQTEKGQIYNRPLAISYPMLKENIKIFDESAEIYWE